MKRRIYLYGIMILLGSCNRQNNIQVEVDPPAVNTKVVVKQHVDIPVQTTGRIVMHDEVKLSFKKGGIIESIQVREGETVTAGQVLARLVQTEFRSSREQAELAFEKAERDFERAEILYRDSVATLEQYQNAFTALELARQSLESVRFNIEHTVIKAPANGKILKKMALPGEITGEGMPVILFGSTDSQWILKTNVVDRDIVKLKLGDSAVITLDALPGIDITASVSEISGMADPYTGTFEIELALDKHYRNLTSGMIAEATVYPSNDSCYWLIPAEALVEGTGHQATVYRYADQKAAELTIYVEEIRENMLFTRNLPEDTLEVIVDGHQFISDGMTVRKLTDDLKQ